MKSLLLLACCCLGIACALNDRAVTDGESRSATGEDGESRIRQPRDLVGYTHSSDGIARVVAHALEAEAVQLEENCRLFGLGDDTALAAAVSPHDDYVYAQQVYVHCYPYLKAPHVVLIGVAHRARNQPACEGKLVFEDFEAWHGPYGPVPISPLRAALLSELADEDVWMDNELHGGEHSIEGMVPFLQHFNREAAIVPILVPYMSWDRLSELAEKTSDALSRIMKAQNLKLGEDVAILISADCVHYGDQGWGGKRFDDFGNNGRAYDQAVARDLSLVSDCLTGVISLAQLKRFFERVVAEDYHEYKITWCGRFSIPFGLSTLIHLNERLGDSAPSGDLLRYGTTLDPGRTDPGVPGLGVTAPANLHHWVGFVAIGYR
ncbi:MAG: AmmeMemoRadiSam system protein B [Planctomycetota bacterium]